MAKFQIGQKIKKVSGKYDIGNTGTVLGWNFGRLIRPEACLLVLRDEPWININGELKGQEVPCLTNPDYWAPILDVHQPGSWRVLDKLLPNLRGMHA